MADVMAVRGCERAQLILVSGLTIAVTMIVLVLLLNTVIYTENIATRGIDSDVGPMTEFQETVDREVETIVLRGNGTGTADSRNEILDGVNASTKTLLTQQADVWLERGYLASGDAEPIPGVVIDGVENDTVEINGVNRFRGASLQFDAGDAGNDSFQIVAGDWGVTVNFSGDEAYLQADEEILCETTSTGAITIDLINATINGEDCNGEVLGSNGIPPDESGGFTVVVTNDDTVSYELVATGESIATDFVGAEWYIDRVIVDLTFVGPDIRYETTRTIIGGAVDG